MQVNAYVHFNGNCREAFEAYAKVLNAEKLELLPHAGTPAEAMVPTEWKGKILHARLVFGGGVLMASDAPPGRFHQPQGFSVCLHAESVPEAERLFQGMSAGGSVTMPLAQTFFAERFAMFTDRFGIPWMINFSGAAGQAGDGAGQGEPGCDS